MSNYELIQSQFTHYGTGDNKSNEVKQISDQEFDYFASGRKNCLYMNFKLELIRRQCAFTKYIVDIPQGKRDMLTIDIPLDTSAKEVPLELLIC